MDTASTEPHVPLAIPEIRGNEWKYIKECLDTQWFSSVGPFVLRFEDMLDAYAAKHCIAAKCEPALKNMLGPILLPQASWVESVFCDDVIARMKAALRA